MTDLIQGSPEWVADRRNRIGASEAAAACGLSTYMSRFRLWEIKRGLVEPEPETEAMRWGTLLEPLVLREWCQKHDAEILTTQYAADVSTDPPIRATIDAIVIMPASPFADRIVEVKTTTSRNKELGIEDDQIPMSWYVQVQLQMAAVGHDEAIVVALVDQREMREFRVKRNDEAIERIVAACAEFWRYVVTGEVPPIEWANVPELPRRHIYLDPGPVMELPTDAAAAWDEYETLGPQIAQLEKRRKAAQEIVLRSMGDCRRAQYGGREIVSKVVSRGAYTVKPCQYVTLRAKEIDE